MVRHVTRPCLCMTTSIIIKITRVISMWTPHWIAVSCHGAEDPMTTRYYCAIFPFCGGGKKKTQKNKGIYDWATRGIPVKSPKHKRVSIPIKQHINETRALTSQFKLTFSTDSVFFPVPFCFSVIPEPFFLPRKRYYQSENLFAFLSIAIVTTKEFHLRMRY